MGRGPAWQRQCLLPSPAFHKHHALGSSDSGRDVKGQEWEAFVGRGGAFRMLVDSNHSTGCSFEHLKLSGPTGARVGSTFTDAVGAKSASVGAKRCQRASEKAKRKRNRKKHKRGPDRANDEHVCSLCNTKHPVPVRVRIGGFVADPSRRPRTRATGIVTCAADAAVGARPNEIYLGKGENLEQFLIADFSWGARTANGRRRRVECCIFLGRSHELIYGDQQGDGPIVHTDGPSAVRQINDWVSVTRRASEVDTWMMGMMCDYGGVTHVVQ